MAKTKRVPESSIPEVQAFNETQERLHNFREQHAQVFEEFEQIAAEYNQKLEAADKACRSQEVSCGPFDLYQTSKKYDWESLFNSLGRERFIQVGGKIATKTVYDGDKARVETSIATGTIPTDVVPRFRTVSPRYHKPGKIDLP